MDNSIDSARSWLAIVRRELDIYDDAVENSKKISYAEGAAAGALMALHDTMMLLDTVMKEQKLVIKEEATNA